MMITDNSENTDPYARLRADRERAVARSTDAGRTWAGNQGSYEAVARVAAVREQIAAYSADPVSPRYLLAAALTGGAGQLSDLEVRSTLVDVVGEDISDAAARGFVEGAGEVFDQVEP